MPRGHILDLRWKALLNDFRRSGLTQAEFCQRRGISIHSFRKRLYRVPTPKPTPASQLSSDGTAPHFLPVTILADPILATAASRQPLELLLRLQGETLADARFQTYGCGATIACGSALAELIKRRSIADCLALTAEDLIEALDGIPADKLHSPALAIGALRNALNDRDGYGSPGPTGSAVVAAERTSANACSSAVRSDGPVAYLFTGVASTNVRASTQPSRGRHVPEQTIP